jgi:hypothetical protein
VQASNKATTIVLKELKMFKLFLTTDVLPKGLNKKLGSHWRTRHKENKSWDLMIACLCSGKLPNKPLERAQISIVRHSYRMLDYDGLVGSMKPVVDSLVSCGVLKDDSWNVLGEWIVKQRFRPKKEGPLLEIMVIGKNQNSIDH